MKTIRDGIGIRLEHLSNHPKNVRKDYGDLTELIESIKEMGLLQNLVVVEVPGTDQNKLIYDRDYWVVAGNRRLLALKAANEGKDYAVATCKIVEMTESEQIAMMLTENINRSSLTPLEEADGFQMMLDLGDTVDDIAKKTGFGKTTVRHRLNIAKIDKDVISQKNEDGWQVSIKDFEKLERVPPENRSEILEKSASPQNLDWQINRYIQEEEDRKKKELTLASIKAKGITEKPKDMNVWDYVMQLRYGDECPDVEGEAYWSEGYGSFTIIRPVELKETEKQRERRLAEEALNDARRKIKDIAKSADDSQHDFVNMRIEEGKLPGDKETTVDILWNTIVRAAAGVNELHVAAFFTGEKYWKIGNDVAEETWQQYTGLPMELQMLIVISEQFTDEADDIVNYNGSYDRETGQKLQAICSALDIFGFSLTAEQKSVIYGASELYTQDEEDEEDEEED